MKIYCAALDEKRELSQTECERTRAHVHTRACSASASSVGYEGQSNLILSYFNVSSPALADFYSMLNHIHHSVRAKQQP